MPKVIKIGIAKNQGDQINEVNSVEAIKGEGLVYDRHLKQNNEKKFLKIRPCSFKLA